MSDAFQITNSIFSYLNTTYITPVIALGSAFIALWSYQETKKSNEIATMAIDEQLRPQIVVCYEAGNRNFEFLFIKNIGNAPALNIKISTPKEKASNMELSPHMKPPAILASNERKILQINSKNEIGLFTIDVTKNIKNRKVIVYYDDVANKRHYKSSFMLSSMSHRSLLSENESVYLGTTVRIGREKKT